jgi:hypothetical protein
MILSKHFKYNSGYHEILLKFPDSKTFYTTTLEKYKLTQENSYLYVLGSPTWIIHNQFMFNDRDKMLEIILDRTCVDRNEYL